MGAFMDLIHTFGDLHKLSKLQDSIEGEINNLQSAGTLPDELKTAFDKLKNDMNTTPSTSSVEDAMKPLKEFGAVLEKYESVFPESAKAIVEKFESVTGDLEGIVERNEQLVEGAASNAENAKDAAQDAVANAENAAKTAVSNAENAVKGAVENAENAVKGAVSNAENAVKDATK